ncbi:MobF family relaxase [Fastidiosibacter lacustris]|uniref:MobF family relaxase n=1 Tax=Fastidiosibacter lacustris TaxID=2056695 RepID=UPI000E343A2C|nr:MobF family relaxase [Fastidiosibacter lacustris]
MMSIGVVSSGSNVHKYFIDKDNYYLTDKSELKEAATWYGKGAELLGIKGEQVDEKLFLDLLHGRLPNGEQVGIMRDGSFKHRPATDITFSAPKSLSIMGLVAGDTRLIEVHNKAVEKALGKIEALYAEARITENGITSYEKTGNLTIAAFRHTSSREKDPQLHTHGVTMNFTQREDGQWRALSSRQKNDVQHLENGFREMLYANQHYLGMIYNSEIAKGTVECGYEIKVKDQYGNFDIVGLSQDYLESQSKRRTQILNKLEEKGLNGAKAAQNACLDSRIAKSDISPDELKAAWIEDAKAQGVSLGKVFMESINNLEQDAKEEKEAEKAKETNSTKNNTPNDQLPSKAYVTSDLQTHSHNAKEAISDAVAHLSQYGVQIKHGDIIRQAFVFSAGLVEHDHLEAVLSDKLKTGELIGREHQYYTTDQLVKVEKDFMQFAKASMVSAWSVNLNRSGLEASLFNHKDRLQLIDVKGLRNEAKLIDGLVKTAENNGLNVYVLHQNYSRLNRLKEDVKRDGSSLWKAFKNHFKHDLLQTVGKFEHDYTQKLNNPFFSFAQLSHKQDLIIVADSQKLGIKDVERLNTLAEKGKAKIAFLNNTESTLGFSAGNPMKLLKESGVNQLRSQSISKNTLVEVASFSEAHKALAYHYVGLDNEAKKNTPIVAFTNKAQAEITGEIRDHLKENGELSLQENHYQTLSTSRLSDIEKTKTQCYQLGDSVTLNPFAQAEENGKSKRSEKGEKNGEKHKQQSYLVTGIDRDNQALHLTNRHGESIQLSLKKEDLFHADGSFKVNFEANKSKTMAIAVGETLRATRNLYLDYQADSIDNSSKSDKSGQSGESNKDSKVETVKTVKIDKNSTFKVQSIAENGIHIQHDNKTIFVANEKLQRSFIEHGYVIKPHQLSKDTDSVLTALSSYQVNQNNIGEIAEFAKKVTLFTDNPEKSTQALNAQQVSWLALDVASGKAQSYNPIVRTEEAIRKDLEVVAKALSGDDKTKADTAVSYGIAKLAEREAGFQLNDLLKESMKYALGSVSLEDIEKIIADKSKQGDLLVTGQTVTTAYAYQLEKNIIQTVKDNHASVAPIYDKVPTLSQEISFTQGQKDAVSLALTTNDRFIGVQGLAGTGKTTMMKELKQHAEKAGFNIIGIAPTHKAVQMLDESINKEVTGSRFEKAGIPVITAHSFINKTNTTHDGHDTNKIDNSKTLFIIDESSMLGNRIYHDIQKKIVSLNARGIFSGDIKQQVAIESGKPQELSMNNGLKYASMNEIVRQNPNPQLKMSAVLAADKQPAKALINLESINPFDHIQRKDFYSSEPISFIEVGAAKDGQGKVLLDDNGKPSLTNLYDVIAKDVLTRIPEQRENTIVVASTHKDRHEIDQRIRQGLINDDHIKNEVNATRLMSKNIDQADMLHAKNYEVGDILRFERGYSVAKKGDYMQVIGIDESQNKLNVINIGDGNNYSINPASIALKADMSVYKELEVQLGVGDRIRLRQSDPKRGWVGGAEYKVSAIEDGKAYLTYLHHTNAQNNKHNENNTHTHNLTIHLTDKKDQLWDYAYTNTTYSAQGATSKYFIGLADENYRSMYIQLTRASMQATIYTANKVKLLNGLEDARRQLQADKLSAYEMLHQSHQQKEIEKNETIKTIKITKGAYNKQHQISNTNVSVDGKGIPIAKTRDKTGYTAKEKIEKPVLADDIKPLLRQRMEELAISLLGEPNKALSNQTQLRFGKNGSLTVNLEKAQWFSHETGKGGNPFDLIKHELNFSDFKDVLDYAKKFVNYTPDMQYIEVKPKPTEQINLEDEKRQERKEKQEQMKALGDRLYQQSVPIKGTLGEKYLAECRGLSCYENADIRFVNSISGIDKTTGNRIYTPAILSVAKDDKDALHHVQVIRLNQDGSKNKDVKITKQTYGKMDGFAVDLNTKADKSVTYLAEGVETGLSILNIHKNAHVLAVLGKSNFANINTDKLADKIVICLDNDFKGKDTFNNEQKLSDHIKSIKRNCEQINALANHFKSYGKEVRFILPDRDKFDFNDVLNQQGYAELSRQVNQLITEKDFSKITNKYIEIKLNHINDEMSKHIKSIKNEYEKSIMQHPSLNHLNSCHDKGLLINETINKSNIYKDTLLSDQRIMDAKKRLDSQLQNQIRHDQIENIVGKIDKVDKINKIDKTPNAKHQETLKSQSVNKEIER